MTVPLPRPTRSSFLAAIDSPREIVRQFTPNWFAVTMGTGILGLALAQLGSLHVAFHRLGEGIWILATLLFILSCGLYAARWILFTGEAKRIFSHSVVSMYLGCIPMALATVINGILVFAVPHVGDAAVALAKTLWWIDAGLAVAVGITIPFLMFTRQIHSVEQMTAIWLLPVVACEVAASSAGLLAPHIADPQAALTVLAAGYVLWALSVPIAMSILVVLLLRMAVHKLPPAAMAASSWLAIGPIGMGALGLMLLGEGAPAIFAANGPETLVAAGPIAQGLGLIGGMLFWGYGLWWLAIALLVTLRYLRDGLPFNLGWWAYVFPLGVYTLATLELATLLPIPALHAFAILLVALLAVIWLIVSVKTVRGAWCGELFHAPCLALSSPS